MSTHKVGIIKEGVIKAGVTPPDPTKALEKSGQVPSVEKTEAELDDSVGFRLTEKVATRKKVAKNKPAE